MSDSLQPPGLQPTRLLCPWDFQVKNTNYSFGNSSCHFLQDPEDLSNPEIEPASPVLQADSLVLNLEGSPELMFITFSFILESSLNLFQPAKIVLNYVSLSPIETT